MHDDFRLEIGEVMRTSAIPKGPTLDPHQKRPPPTTRSTIGSKKAGSEGGLYGAGPVMVWDEGTSIPKWETAKGVREAVFVRPEAEAVMRAAVGGLLKFCLAGHKLQGSFALICT